MERLGVEPLVVRLNLIKHHRLALMAHTCNDCAGGGGLTGSDATLGYIMNLQPAVLSGETLPQNIRVKREEKPTLDTPKPLVVFALSPA